MRSMPVPQNHLGITLPKKKHYFAKIKQAESCWSKFFLVSLGVTPLWGVVQSAIAKGVHIPKHFTTKGTKLTPTTAAYPLKLWWWQQFPLPLDMHPTTSQCYVPLCPVTFPRCWLAVGTSWLHCEDWLVKRHISGWSNIKHPLHCWAEGIIQWVSKKII